MRIGLAGAADDGIARLQYQALRVLRADLQDVELNADQWDAIHAERRQIMGVLAARISALIARRGIPGFATPAIVVGSECAAGDVVYRLVPSDSRVRLHIIKQFHYLVCQARGINPMDPDACIGWQQGEGALGGAGTYVHVAEWPDGRSYRGSYTVTEAAVGALDPRDPDAPLVVPVALPQC